jgi:hypothetical protein
VVRGAPAIPTLTCPAFYFAMGCAVNRDFDGEV